MPIRSRFATKEEYAAWYREYRAKRREALREYNRAYNKKWRKEHNYRTEKVYQERHPEKIKAQRKLHSAVQSGKIKRQPCQMCGLKAKVHGHHEDYNKPYDVIWLCPLHHKHIHLGLINRKDLQNNIVCDSI